MTITNYLDIHKSSHNIVTMKFTVTKVPKYGDAIISHDIERYDIGIALIGTKRSKKKKLRRLIRCRGSNGMTTYFFWVGDDKGKELMKVVGFTRVKGISKEKAKKHFSKIK